MYTTLLYLIFKIIQTKYKTVLAAFVLEIYCSRMPNCHYVIL